MYQILNVPIVKGIVSGKKKKRKILSSTISRLNARIKRKIKNSYYRIKGGKRTRNFCRRSYFVKYVFKKRSKFRRTFYLPKSNSIKYKRVAQLYKVIKELTRLRNPRLIRLRRKGKLKPILEYRLGLITIRRKPRNFFATIHKYLDQVMEYDPFKILKGIKHSKARIKMDEPFKYEVVFKSTVGQTGYKGPKRKTQLGTKRVGKACSIFLRKNKFTAYDLVFCRDFSQRYTFFIKGLTNTRFWVRRIDISRRHSHGFTRGSKPRR